MKNAELKSIAQELDEICLNKGVIGYHFTRAFREDIEKSGLVPCDGRKRRQEFLSKFGNRFTLDQRNWIIRIWDWYFSPYQSQARDGKISFNFTLDALKNEGAKNLLAYYGGESIYMPLIENAEISAVLQSIGQPLIIRCALEPNILSASTEIPWGKIWLSSYHLAINPIAVQFDQDAFQEQPVLATQILSIIPADQL